MSLRLNYSFWRRADVRLALWYTAALLLTLALVTTFFAYRLHRGMLKQVDAVLLDEMHEIEGFLKAQEHKAGSVKRFVRAQLDKRKHFRFHVRVLNPDEIRSMDQQGPDSGPFQMSSSILQGARAGRVQYQTLQRRIPFRQLSALLKGSKNQSYLIQISTELENIRNALRNFFRNLYILIPVALFLCAMGGWWMAHKMLSPIGNIARTAEQISAQNLKERLRTSGTGDEMDELALTINRMLSRLERSFHEIRRFTADAAHELRTPLCAMRGEGEVLLSTERSAADYRAALEGFMEQCDRLTRLTNDLLLLARFEAQNDPIRRERVPMDELLRDLSGFFEVLAQDRGIRLRVSAENGTAVLGDQTRLQQAFSNLLDNAVKYTPDGGEITVEIEEDPSRLRVRITNNGEVISPEDLPHVFERFYRVDKSRSRDTGGSGLGLSITRKIVEAHGGHIEIQSAPGRGTQVTVALPRAP